MQTNENPEKEKDINNIDKKAIMGSKLFETQCTIDNIIEVLQLYINDIEYYDFPDDDKPKSGALYLIRNALNQVNSTLEQIELLF